MTASIRFLLLALIPAAACAGARASPEPVSVPEYLVGSFTDDYGSRYTISRLEWAQLPGTRYRIVRWDVPGQFALAQNDMANPADGGLWTRIDWLRLTGMPPYEWAYCYSAYKAPSLAVAETVSVARRATPKTGCNGFPFSRMRRMNTDTTRTVR
jgi:hypothetical protein